MTIQVGATVRMTEALKAHMCGDCAPGAHVGLPSGIAHPDMPDDGCLRCSCAHVAEFGGCVGVVLGHVIGPSGEPWPELDVR